MAQKVPARMTATHSGELVVFLLGMRINKPHRPDLWWPVMAAMPRMLAELSRDRDSGLLGFRTLLGAGGPTVVQYWSSHEKLYAYAGAIGAEHRPAWAEFNRRARKVPGAVGIWHETFLVDRAESIYVSVPTMGLAAATSAVPVTARGDSARARLAGAA